jgi:anti-sigma factor ChrR (cupin superfamily)
MQDWQRQEWKATRYPGVEIAFLESDRESGYAAVLIRMAPGASYPAHRHRGSEELFVLEGAYEDEAGRYEAGRFVRYEDGSVHHPRCPAEEEGPCVFFAISREGIELFES